MSDGLWPNLTKLHMFGPSPQLLLCADTSWCLSKPAHLLHLIVFSYLFSLLSAPPWAKLEIPSWSSLNMHKLQLIHHNRSSRLKHLNPLSPINEHRHYAWWKVCDNPIVILNIHHLHLLSWVANPAATLQVLSSTPHWRRVTSYLVTPRELINNATLLSKSRTCSSAWTETWTSFCKLISSLAFRFHSCALSLESKSFNSVKHPSNHICFSPETTSDSLLV